MFVAKLVVTHEEMLLFYTTPTAKVQGESTRKKNNDHKDERCNQANVAGQVTTVYDYYIINVRSLKLLIIVSSTSV